MMDKKPSFQNNNASRSVLSITSPAKLNIISSAQSNVIDWKKCNKRISKNGSSISTYNNILPRSKSLNVNGNIFNRPKLTITSPPTLLKRSSSFFKEDFLFHEDDNINQKNENGVENDNYNNGSSENSTTNGNDNTDRFIPLFQSNIQNKIDPNVINEEIPPPNAPPKDHLKAQTKLVFKQNVAEACGLNMKQRILQYLPTPPITSFQRTQYSLNKRLDNNKNLINDNGKPIKLRKINTNPERILDAPGFIDDFYLNLLSWSRRNVMAIALNQSLYIWNANDGSVQLLTEFKDDNITVSSVTWSDDAYHLSIGKTDGNTEIWDTESMSLIRTMRSGLNVRIGSQSWLETLIATGSKTGEIQINDVRIKKHIVSTWTEHEGEICGLTYKDDGLQLASGGNDNCVRIWDTRTSLPLFTKRTHNAAVKALSWCPYMNNVLATGGGQNDKFIHFWNTNNGNKLGSIDTGSQVSSLHWGQSYNSNGTMNREIVATGGNPNNCISIFNFDSKFKVAEIMKAHESRICCSQLSPDGTTIATVGGDENLKFYNIFDERRQLKNVNKNGILMEHILQSNDSTRASLDLHTRNKSNTKSYLIR